jgi:anaerobic ribonucleoside-triphosphate reductase activating protein
LADDILNTPDIEGITISGGEPFLQSEALVDLIVRLKAKKDLGVIVYTGMSFNEIKGAELTKLCDLIIDGEYKEELNDGLSLRGSSNQNTCLLTDRYKEEVKTLYGIEGRKIELHIKGEKTKMVGIPDKNSLKLFTGM